MIVPSVGLQEAATGIWDVIVIGAGPAGTIAAGYLARNGARTLLVDRRSFPRSKICGGCLNLVALEALNSAGWGHLVSQLGGVPLKRLRLGLSGRSTELALPGGKALSRERLDLAMVETAVRSGVCFLPQADGMVGALDLETRRVDLTQSQRTVTVHARVVLVATGLGQPRLEGDPVVYSYPSRNSRIGAGSMIRQLPRLVRDGSRLHGSRTGRLCGSGSC